MKKRISILVLLAFVAAGAFAQGSIGGGLLFDYSGNNGVSTSIPSFGDLYSGYRMTSFGGFIFYDYTYVEATVSFAYGSITTVMDVLGTSATEDGGSATQLGFTLLGKYPIKLGSITFFPLLGINYNMVVSASDADGNSIDDAMDLSQFGIQTGVGLDFNLTESLYFRAEGLFQFRFANKWQDTGVDSYKALGLDAKTTLGMGPVFKVAIGYKLSGGSSKAPPGTLTITGIPAEYEGKYISANIKKIPDFSAKIRTSGSIAGGDRTIIANGEAKLPVNIHKGFGIPSGYAGSDTGDISFEITDRVKSDDRTSDGYDYRTSSVAAVAAVSFESGAAEIKWGDTVSGGYITVTNIPETYYRVGFVYVGTGAKKLPLTPIFGFETQIGIGSVRPTSVNDIRNGTITVPIPTSRTESGYMPFPQSGTVDIVVELYLTSDKGKITTVADVFLFKAVPVTNGKATVNFRQGAKQ